MPLHWFTEVTSWVEDVVLVTGPKFKGQEGNVTPAAARHALVVTVELVAPPEVVVFTTVTVQDTWKPAVMGKSGGLH
jgi:ribosomal protein L24